MASNIIPLRGSTRTGVTGRRSPAGQQFSPSDKSPRRRRSDVRRRPEPLAWLLLAGAICLVMALAGCGSGASNAATDPPPPASSPTAPSNGAGTGSGSTAPLPDCPTTPGSNTSIATCQNCPAADVSGSFCVVPTAPPVQCPQGDTGTPPNCVAPPVCAAPDTLQGGVCVAPPAAVATLTEAPATGAAGYVLTWSSVNATQCELGPSGTLAVVGLSGSETVDPTSATTYTLVCAGTGGNAELSVTVPGGSSSPQPPAPPTCTPPAVLINGTCQAPPTVGVSLSISPTSVVDSSLGCPDPAGDSCVATVTVTAASSVLGDAVVCYPAGSQQAINPAIGYSVGPFPAAQDGPQVITVNCTDEYDQTGTASITLDVMAPKGPTQPDTLTVAGSDPYTFTWSTTSTAGAGGCFVELAAESGAGPFASLTALQPGGTSQGSATTAWLSPMYGPYQATLYCSGAPDPGVPSVTVSP